MVCDASKVFVSPSSHSHSFLPTSASYTSLMHFPGRAHGMKNYNAHTTSQVQHDVRAESSKTYLSVVIESLF